MTAPPHLLLLTEGDRRRGLGHLGRCQGYAAWWRRRGHEVRWLVDGDEAARRMLAGENVQWEAWQDRDRFPEAEGAIVVADSYTVTLKALQAVADSAAAAVFIDDLERDDYPPGFVVHSAPGRLEREGRAARWLIGPRWQPMDAAFWRRSPRPPANAEARRALVLTGGADLRNLGVRLARVARETLGEACSVDMVVGAGAAAAAISAPWLTIHRALPSYALRNLMLSCDVAISAAGQTLYQLAFCGAPAVIVGVADNQAKHLREWPRTGAMTSAGMWWSEGLENRVGEALTRLGPPHVRQAFSTAGQAQVDGGGTARLSALIEETLR